MKRVLKHASYHFTCTINKFTNIPPTSGSWVYSSQTDKNKNWMVKEHTTDPDLINKHKLTHTLLLR